MHNAFTFFKPSQAPKYADPDVNLKTQSNQFDLQVGCTNKSTRPEFKADTNIKFDNLKNKYN